MSDTNDSQKIIDCPHCGKAISATSEKCSYCQQEINQQPEQPQEDNKTQKLNIKKILFIAYTGDLKVHIKSADGRYGDLGWVRLSQISGYAKGTPGVDRDQIAIVDEEGRELQIPNGKGGRITKLEKGTGVIPHTATEKLMALSEQLDNNGNMVINGRTIEEYVNDMANMQSIAVPDFSDVTASVVGQLESKGMGNVMVENHYDSLLTVEGNVDKDTLPGLEDILKRSYEYTSKQMVKELRKGGMQIRR